MIHLLGGHDIWECVRAVAAAGVQDTPNNREVIRAAIQSGKEAGINPARVAFDILASMMINRSIKETVSNLIEDSKPKKGHRLKAE